MAAPTSKRCSCTSPAPAPSWRRRNNGALTPRDPPYGRDAFFAGPDLGDAAALSLHPAQLLAAHLGALVLSDPADADLGVHEPVPLSKQQLRRARLRRAARGGNAVGPVVPLAARAVDLVSGRDVG